MPTIDITGDGILAKEIRTALALLADGWSGGPIEIVAADAWTAPSPAEGVRRLTVHAELGTVLIGPLETPGKPGCQDCVEWRRHQARQSAEAFQLVRHRHGNALKTSPSAWLTPLAASTVGALVAAECARLGADEAAWTDGAIMIVELADLSVARHRYQPNPRCSTCGNLPADMPDAHAIQWRPQPKLGPDTHRTRAISDDLESLREAYVDEECGLIRGIVSGTMGGLVVANAPIRLADGRDENGFGRTRSYRRAELVAILEALERLGGTRPGGKTTTVTASYLDVADHALDPRTVGTHPETSYATSGFRFRRFTPTEICNWVWGYSLTRDEPILVPETLAYYRLHQHTHEQCGFVYDLSNGCALGSSLEEAILHGLLEIIERDAFLTTWYAQLPAPRIDLHAITNREIRLTAAAIQAQTGYDVHVYDTTMEHGIPSALVLAVNPRDEWPKMTCTAGSALNPEQSILNALDELGPIVQAMSNLDPADNDRAAKMLDDPTLVVTMEDHTTLYTHPDAYRRLDFLTSTANASALGPANDAYRHEDLTDDLRSMVRRLQESGMDVLFVDQTTAEHRATDLACVKVIVPGSVPMTFGHLNRRTDGLPRLLNAPRTMRLSTAPLSYQELNPHPHPFP